MTVSTRRGDRGVFDKLFDWVERLREMGEYPYGLEEHVMALERIVQDIDDKELTQLAETRISYWLDVASGEKDSLIVVALESRLRTLLHILATWLDSSAKPRILAQIRRLEPIPPPDYVPQQELHARVRHLFDKALEHLKRTATETRDVAADEVAILSEALAEGSEADLRATIRKMLRVFGAPVSHSRIPPAEYQWDITVTFLSRAPRASTCGYMLWALANGLEFIPGVEVYVDEVGLGSWWTKFKVNMKNAWARDDVQEVLAQSRKGLEAQYVEKPCAEVDILREEKKKLEEETKIIAKQRDLLPSRGDEAERRSLELRRSELDLREREAEIRGKELDNAIRSLEVLEKASTLIRSGIIKTDPVKVDINGLIYVALKEGKCKIGKSMKRIAAARSGDVDDMST